MSVISKTPKPVNISEDPALGYLNQHVTYAIASPIVNANSAAQCEPVTQLITNVFQVNPPQGSNGSIQFNQDGSYIGDTGLQFEPTTDTLTTGIVIANSITIHGTASNLHVGGGSNQNVLTTDGTGNLTWGDVLPARSGNIGKFLVTNGVSTEWSSVPYASLATKSDVDIAIADLVGIAPAMLDTLGEIATIIGQTDNPEYSIISQLANKANITSLADVAFSGSYTDLSYVPTISTAGTTGRYTDLIDRPTIPVSIMDLGISDGTTGKVLTTEGNGHFIFANVVVTSLVNDTNILRLNGNGTVTFPDSTVQSTAFTGPQDLSAYALVTSIPADYINKAELKTVVADSTDFADFQARIAAL